MVVNSRCRVTDAVTGHAPVNAAAAMQRPTVARRSAPARPSDASWGSASPTFSIRQALALGIRLLSSVHPLHYSREQYRAGAT